MKTILYFRGNNQGFEINTGLGLLTALVHDDWYSTEGLLDIIEEIADPVKLEKVLAKDIEELIKNDCARYS